MEDKTKIELDDGSRVAVIGGGPSGAFFSYFLIDMAERVGTDLQVDIYEPKDFSRPGPQGCNMCGGVVHESVVQILATEGMNLPPTVVQRGIDSHVLHMGMGDARIETPLHEKRIGAMYRGAGPKGMKESRWASLDGHLLSLAIEKGANLVRERVTEVGWDDGRPLVKTRKGEPQTYDLVAAAVGVNTAALKLFQDWGIGYQPPPTAKTHVREYYLGEETVEEYLGSSVHVFLLNIRHLEFAALIPKGDYVTMCMIGEELGKGPVQALLEMPEVKGRFPPNYDLTKPSCQCSPKVCVQGATRPFADRVVFVGDCGVTRYYKDGIGSAYRAAKSAAVTAVFQGVSASDFEDHYWPVCRSLNYDNILAKVVFGVIGLIQKMTFARRAVLRTIRREQEQEGANRRLSMIMWDMYTGSAPYGSIFVRTLHPAFWVRFLMDLAVSLVSKR
jgi:flavin-dependent dehydrogenase